MTARTITRILSAIAVLLAGILVAVLVQRPQPAADSTIGPTTTKRADPSISSAAHPSAGSLGGTDPAGEGEPSDLPSSEVDDHSGARGQATHYSQTDHARRQWEPVVTGFGQAYTETRGKANSEWNRTLEGFVTETVGDQLATVDLRDVPAGTLSRVEPAEYGDDKVAVFLHYDSGLTLVAYLILHDGTWRVYAYDRWED